MDNEYNDATDELHDAASTVSTVEEKKDTSVEPTEGPVGVDIGTSRIVEYHKDGLKFTKHSQLNAFYPVPFSTLAKNMMEQNHLLHKRTNGNILVVGNGAESFANISNGEVRRPMASGILNPSEKDGSTVIEQIVRAIIDKPKNLGDRLCFSIPAQERGTNLNPVFHESVIRNYFVSMGYMAKGVNEGYLTVLSELQKDNYTGIGISCGAGLCNVCLSYLSVPILTFSMSKAGDYIDSSAAAAVGEHTNRIRVIKEDSLNLMAEPKDRIEKALHIYYEDMVMSLIQHIKAAMEESEHMPKLDNAIPIVLSGGAVMPEGFRDKFDNVLRSSNFPVSISEVRLADEPLYATAKGAYLAACAEEGEE